jgi:hypothetical protein
MELTAKNVEDLFVSCLFKEGENTEAHIQVEGIKVGARFHPERIVLATPAIGEMLKQLPEGFLQDVGGGQSFLTMSFDKLENQWGDHRSADKLVCLGLASGKLICLTPRIVWTKLPGGVPYYVVV